MTSGVRLVCIFVLAGRSTPASLMTAVLYSLKYWMHHSHCCAAFVLYEAPVISVPQCVVSLCPMCNTLLPAHWHAPTCIQPLSTARPYTLCHFVRS